MADGQCPGHRVGSLCGGVAARDPGEKMKRLDALIARATVRESWVVTGRNSRMGALLAIGVLLGANGLSFSPGSSALRAFPADALASRDAQSGVHTFLTGKLGSPRPSESSAAIHDQRAGAAIEPGGGYTFRRGDASVTLATEGASRGPWPWYANGAARQTPFGAETVIVMPDSTEQFLTVSRRQGPKMWRWSLRAPGLTPRLGVDGTIEFWRG